MLGLLEGAAEIEEHEEERIQIPAFYNLQTCTVLNPCCFRLW